MYPVSDAFLLAVQENTRTYSYYWMGRITAASGAVYEFGYEDIVKDGNEPVMEYGNKHRFLSSFSDFITRYCDKTIHWMVLLHAWQRQSAPPT